MAYTQRTIKRWRTDKGQPDFNGLLYDEFLNVKTEYDKAIQSGAGTSGIKTAYVGPTVSTAAGVYTWSFGVTFTTAPAILVTQFNTTTDGGSWTTASTTHSIITTSAASATFSAFA